MKASSNGRSIPVKVHPSCEESQIIKKIKNIKHKTSYKKVFNGRQSEEQGCGGGGGLGEGVASLSPPHFCSVVSCANV